MGLKAVIPSSGVTTSVSVGQNPINIPAQSGLYILIVDNPNPTIVNLPNPYGANQIVKVQDGGMNAATYPITVQGNGLMINNPNGAASSYEIGQNGTTANFTSQGALNTWGVE